MCANFGVDKLRGLGYTVYSSAVLNRAACDVANLAKFHQRQLNNGRIVIFIGLHNLSSLEYSD